jgi:hypothetical protein
VGFYEEFGPHGTRRGETYTCAHCQFVVDITPAPPQPKAPIYVCRNCQQFDTSGTRVIKGRVCGKCHAKGTCTPIEKRLDEFEKKVRAKLSAEELCKAAGALLE